MLFFFYLREEICEEFFVVCQLASFSLHIKRTFGVSYELARHDLTLKINFQNAHVVTLVQKLEKAVLALSAAFPENYVACSVLQLLTVYIHTFAV
jgi:hypothetical protein